MAFAATARAGWTVVSQVSTETAYAPADRQLAERLGLWTIALAMTMISIVLLARRLDRLAAEEARQQARLLAQERSIAGRLQEALLPSRLPEPAGLVLRARYRPGDGRLRVGGDWFETLERPDGRLVLAVGDVVGHGLEAAATMGRLRAAFAAVAPGAATPAELVVRLDRFVESVPAAWASTLTCLFLDPDGGRAEYLNAGHPPPVVVRADGGAAELLSAASSWPLAAAPPESRSPAVGVAGMTRLTAACRQLEDADLDRFCDTLIAGMTAGSTIEDDIALLVVRRLDTAQPGRVGRSEDPGRTEQVTDEGPERRYRVDPAEI